jgi:hypothetical protein
MFDFRRFAMAAKPLPVIQRLHTDVSTALWAGLTAVLVFFAVFTLPHIEQNQASYRAAKAAEISAENDVYCRHWNFVPGTDVYRSCLDDLQTLRRSIEKRTLEDYEF